MAISKIGSKALVDCSVAAVDIADGSITNAKLTNTSITVNGNAVSLGGSVDLKAIDWQAVVNTNTTMVAGRGYFVDTTSGAITMTLPASASAGDTIAIKDYAATFNTNNLTIGRNGHNIQGVANDSLISTARASLVLVYIDSTKGWLYTVESNVSDFGPQYITATGGTITTSGDFKIHTFTGDGCFVVSQIGSNGGPSAVDYIVVAGGGGGGASNGSPGNISSYAAGGGGAGGFRESHSTPVSGCYTASPLATPTGITLTATTYPVTVGAGGSGGPGCSSPYTGTNGSNSVFSTITSAGGGRGGVGGEGGNVAGANGGSGGGGGGVPNSPGGSGNTPPTSPPQGNSGGTGDSSGPTGGGGGGGATAVGQTTPNPGCKGGDGGAGATTLISGSPTAYAGGGGGGHGYYLGDGSSGGSGGVGGGGAGGGPNVGPTAVTLPQRNATANTGGGGGGAISFPSTTSSGGSGGKGIVIIRYKYQ